ncbi:cytochrome P450 [Lentzea sp. NPDC005914]|uniref:cytochrome P450 n=1 Tax=Lentzea sp. NPDC005914 TaxID=3154572 RepID=UPI0033E78918
MAIAYDPLNSLHLANPYPLFVHLRASEPVFFSEENGYWVVSRYENVVEVLRDPSFVARSHNLDPQVRKALQATFSPRRMTELEPLVRDYADRLIDGFPGLGYGDFVQLFADPFPAMVMRLAIGTLSPEEQKPLADFDMTVNVLALGMRSLLAGRREPWIGIVDDPATIPSVIEELLRYEGPIVSLFRYATENAEIGGHPVPAGAQVQLLLAAANRDEAVYHCPESFDPSRQMPTVHLSLGAGAHFCVGAPLARMQTRVALEQLSSRLPGLRLAPGQEVTFRPDLRTRVPAGLIVEW